MTKTTVKQTKTTDNEIKMNLYEVFEQLVTEKGFTIKYNNGTESNIQYKGKTYLYYAGSRKQGTLKLCTKVVINGLSEFGVYTQPVSPTNNKPTYPQSYPVRYTNLQFTKNKTDNDKLLKLITDYVNQLVKVANIEQK